MSYIKEMYIPLKENAPDRVNKIKVGLYYDMGGYNYYTYKEKKRGYYLLVVPCEVKGNCVTTTGFSGYNRCIVECKRRSQKQEGLALETAPDHIKDLVKALPVAEFVDGDLDELIREGWK